MLWGRRRTNRLDQYDSWTKYITYLKQPDNYADVLFVFGLSTIYYVAVRIVNDSYDEPHVYYLGDIEPTDMITVCYLPSAEHYYASRVIAPTTEEPTHISAPRQDVTTVEVLQEMNIQILPEQPPPTKEDYIQNALLSDNGVQSVVISQATPSDYYSCFRLGASAHKDIRRRSKITNR